MKKPKQPHPDQHIHDGTWEHFVEKHNEKPWTLLFSMMLLMFLTLLAVLYSAHGDVSLVGPRLLASFVIDFIIMYHYIPKWGKKYVSTSKRHQKKYLQKVRS
ncbi:MAG: hypothetical protein ABIO57_00565 [Candidatus Paceibacterota bacterium]